MTDTTDPTDTEEVIYPTHDCEIQGPNTEYQRTVNIKTGETGWLCLWCEMAKKIRGEL